MLAYRHQSATSVIEATALDVGMLIFSLLALGLARKGLAAKTERALIVACAAGSALMNYAAADVTSPRSVLAYCMPPVFLAVVVDRVVATTRRHVLGMREARSPWSVLGTGAGRALRVLGRVVLYALRLFLAPVSTPQGPAPVGPGRHPAARRRGPARGGQPGRFCARGVRGAGAAR